MDQSNEIIEAETIQGVLRLTITRAEKKNALNSEAVQLLTEYFLETTTGSYAAIFLNGAGEDSFCSGADLKEITSKEGKFTFFRQISELIAAMLECPLPIITKVQGYALAGGMGLVAASDVVIASSNATFGLPEIKLGILPSIVMGPLSRKVPRAFLSKMVLDGRSISAEEAFRIGLVSKLVSPEALDDEIESFLSSLGRKNPCATKAAKEILNMTHPMPQRSELYALADRVAVLSESEWVDEKIEEFLKK